VDFESDDRFVLGQNVGGKAGSGAHSAFSLARQGSGLRVQRLSGNVTAVGLPHPSPLVFSVLCN
jgi:hypothetical protein